MSYDLMVFEPTAAPTARSAFMRWFEAQTEWSEPHGYNNPEVASPGLQAWYKDMIGRYPNMNIDVDDVDSPMLTDYSIGRSVIYAGFAWSQMEDAYMSVRRFAVRHHVGFFDVSADNGEIWFPPPDDDPSSKPGFWRRFMRR